MTPEKLGNKKDLRGTEGQAWQQALSPTDPHLLP